MKIDPKNCKNRPVYVLKLFLAWFRMVQLCVITQPIIINLIWAMPKFGGFAGHSFVLQHMRPMQSFWVRNNFGQIVFEQKCSQMNKEKNCQIFFPGIRNSGSGFSQTTQYVILILYISHHYNIWIDCSQIVLGIYEPI